jgi:glycosyltransferase involved in cell wall biosynthesis
MLLSEEELTENWGDWDPNEPVVSVICCTYNQEMYIEDALKGFFSQKTDFPFEVIIQNDASTDATKEIIDRWYEKYSNVLKPYHHEENQFSQGHKPAQSRLVAVWASLLRCVREMTIGLTL